MDSLIFLNGSPIFLSFTSVSIIIISFVALLSLLTIFFQLFRCIISKSLERMRSFILFNCPQRSFTFLRYQLRSSSRLFWYSLNYNYFLISRRFKFSCLCSYFSILSYISVEVWLSGGGCSLQSRWLSVLYKLLRMREVMLSASLVTSMLAVLIERQFMIFSILFRANTSYEQSQSAIQQFQDEAIQKQNEGGCRESGLFMINFQYEKLQQYCQRIKTVEVKKEELLILLKALNTVGMIFVGCQLQEFISFLDETTCIITFLCFPNIIKRLVYLHLISNKARNMKIFGLQADKLLYKSQYVHHILSGRKTRFLKLDLPSSFCFSSILLRYFSTPFSFTGLSDAQVANFLPITQRRSFSSSFIRPSVFRYSFTFSPFSSGNRSLMPQPFTLSEMLFFLVRFLLDSCLVLFRCNLNSLYRWQLFLSTSKLATLLVLSSESTFCESVLEGGSSFCVLRSQKIFSFLARQASLLSSSESESFSTLLLGKRQQRL